MYLQLGRFSHQGNSLVCFRPNQVRQISIIFQFLLLFFSEIKSYYHTKLNAVVFNWTVVLLVEVGSNQHVSSGDALHQDC